MRTPKKPKRTSGKSASTFDGLRLRIQGAPIGSSADGLVQQLFAARASLSAQEIKQLESLIAGRKANGELT
jgi:hypothetical protein